MPEPTPTQAKPKTKTKMAAGRTKKASVAKRKGSSPVPMDFESSPKVSLEPVREKFLQNF